MKISVAMAAYNGENYIKEQLMSVFPQLGKDDEVVVSLDPSTDGTAALLADLAKTEPRLRVISGGGKGVVANFANALEAADGDIIFLCDQDDVWRRDKVEKVVKAFASPKKPLLVLHDAVIVDGSLQEREPSFFAWRGVKQGFWQNLLKNSYIGCCMAIRRELKELALPFPPSLPMHDQWLGLLAEKRHGVAFLEEPLVFYRRHGENVSADTHSSVKQMLAWRFAMLKAIGKRERL